MAPIVSLAALSAYASPLAAADIQPSDRVVRFVNVREGPASVTKSIERLEPGEAAELIESFPVGTKYGPTSRIFKRYQPYDLDFTDVS
jgi:hypothetical protein